MKADAPRKATKKKYTPMIILKPGERVEHWEKVLRWRDEADPRWRSMAASTRAAAEAYERNRDAEAKAAA